MLFYVTLHHQNTIVSHPHDLFFQQQYISPSDIRKRLTEYLAAPKALFMVRDPEDPSGIFIKFSNLETVSLFVCWKSHLFENDSDENGRASSYENCIFFLNI